MKTNGRSRYVYTPRDGMPSYFTIDVRSDESDYTDSRDKLIVDVRWRREVEENLTLMNNGQANAQQKAFMMMLKKLWEKFCKFEQKLARPYVVEKALEQIKERNLDFYNFLTASVA